MVDKLIIRLCRPSCRQAEMGSPVQCPLKQEPSFGACTEAKTELWEHLVDAGHHSKYGCIGDGCGVQACLRQLSRKLMAAVPGCTLCHHHLHCPLISPGGTSRRALPLHGHILMPSINTAAAHKPSSTLTSPLLFLGSQHMGPEGCDQQCKEPLQISLLHGFTQAGLHAYLKVALLGSFQQEGQHCV